MEAKDQEYKFILDYTVGSKTDRLETITTIKYFVDIQNLFILFVHFLWKLLEEVQKISNQPKKHSKGESRHHNWGQI